MRRVLGWWLVVAAVAAMALPAQAASLKELLGGKELPLTMQLKDLGPDWLRLSVGDQSGTGGLTSLYMAIMGGASGTGGYFTQGETASLGGERYLVAYQVRPKPVNLARLMESSRPPTPEPLTPESVLSLSLLNLRAITALNDVRPFDLQQELAASGEQSEMVESVQERSTTAESLSNLKQISLGLLMYTQDWDERMPPDMNSAAALQEKLQPYTKNTSLFTNPITGAPYMANAVLSGKKLQHISDPASMVLFFEDAPAADGTRGVAFLDGHAKRISESEWPSLKKASKVP